MTDMLPRGVFERIDFDVLINALTLQTVDLTIETSLRYNTIVGEYALVHPGSQSIYSHLMYQLARCFRLQAFLMHFSQNTGFYLPLNAYFNPHIAAKEISYHVFTMACQRLASFEPMDLVLWSHQSEENVEEQARAIQ